MMMTEARVWTTGGFVENDPWHIVEDGAEASESNEMLMLPLAAFLERTETGRNGVGVVLGPADAVADLEPYLDDLPAIALTFPAFNDGRAFSQASLLRSRYGYRGEIRATGDVLIDQIPLMLRCGIDSFLVKNPTALRRLAENRLPGIDSYYQPAAVPTRAAGGYSWRRTPGATAQDESASPLPRENA
jgi:uncharacterized protein (DUF934 family)